MWGHSTSIFGLLSDDLNRHQHQFDDTGGCGFVVSSLTEIDHVIDSSFHSITDFGKTPGRKVPR